MSGWVVPAVFWEMELFLSEEREIWRPGSFTKNFSWGDGAGLSELHAVIRAGFNDTMADVPRDEFRDRIRPSG